MRRSLTTPPAGCHGAGTDGGDPFVPDETALVAALTRVLDARRQPGSPHPPPAESHLPSALPDDGVGGAAALDLLAVTAVDDATRLNHPGFFAHMDPPTPWITWAAALWAASSNQNLLHPDTASRARELERQVVSWLAPAFGMSGGHLVPGSTLATLTALWAARDLTGAISVVTSEAAHVSVAKSARVLGLPLTTVPTDGQQRLDPTALPDDLSRTILVLTAGTTATGAIDPLDAGRGRAAWRHVDAAWAGPLRLTRYAALLKGIEHADSVSVSAHKWLYQPKESALVLYADPERVEPVLTWGGGYLAAPNVGLLGSHGQAALPLAATLLAFGRRGLARLIEADVQHAAHLAQLIDADPAFELKDTPTTGVVVWRPRDADPRGVREHLDGAWVSITEVDDTWWWRSVAANPHADPAAVLHAARAALRHHLSRDGKP